MIIMTKMAILASGAALAAMVANGVIEQDQSQSQLDKLAQNEIQLRKQAQADRSILRNLNQKFHDAGVGAQNDIDVRVYKGVAYLSGYSNTRQEKGEAVDVIEEVPGIVAVNDRDLRYIVDLPKVMVRADQPEYVVDQQGRNPVAIASR